MKQALFLEKVTLLQRSEDMSQIYLGKRITGRGTVCAKPEWGHAWNVGAETRRSCATQECSEREKNDRRV